MEKRIFIAVVISIAFLGLWSVVIPKLFPELVKKPAPVAAKPAVAKTTPAPKSATPAVAPAAAMQAVAPVSGTTLQQSVVDMPEFTAVFSNRGAELVSFKLKHYTTSDKQPVELVKGREASRTDFPFSIETKGQTPFNSALYAVTERDDRGVRVIDYRYSDGHTTVTKTFRVGPEYQFDFAVNITPPMPYRVEIGPGIRTLAPDEIDSRFVVTGNGVAQSEGKLKVLAREKGDRVNVYDDIQFVGIEDNYFLSVLKPAKGGQAVIHRADFKDGKEIRKELYAGVNATADGTV